MERPANNTSDLTLRALQALDCLNTTQAPVFLTGNAGTGKTTFLKNLWQHTHKRYIVVAPTGIAALNAGGTTIHSQFLLPFGNFIPGKESRIDSVNGSGIYNQHLLARKYPLNSHRKKILRSIDLLVIDEVSMLRADLLDAIDYRLRAARANYHQPFGGVQVLFIGDLHQLPPVVKREDEITLKSYYSSPWFFESHCLKNQNLIYIELDKIFRQQDERFIGILNNLRHNRATCTDYNILNEYYKENLDITQTKETITLTTHNNQADTINQFALEQLPGNARQFRASVNGDFPSAMYPVPEILSLKKNSQVMFVKNDSEGKTYFNGRIATILGFTDDGIEVRMHDDGTKLTVGRQTWENKKYEVNPENQEITDSVAGTFEQLPVKLAWAITIHKSQGLTFDKAIIDPGRAFADGQVYVALSRLRSLDGLILKTKIHPGIVSTDPVIVNFSTERNQPENFEFELGKRQKEYLGGRLISAFDFQSVIRLCKAPDHAEDASIADHSDPFKGLRCALTGQQLNTDRFRAQLLGLLETDDRGNLLSRLEKGVSYYSNFFQDQLKSFLEVSLKIKSRKKTKSLSAAADEIDHLIMSKLDEIERLPLVVKGILDRESLSTEIFKQLEQKRQNWRRGILEALEKTVEVESADQKPKKVRKKRNSSEPASHDFSINLFHTGMNVDQIAAERQLSPVTIEEHLARGVAEKKLELTAWVNTNQQLQIATAASALNKPFRLKDLVESLQGQFSYGQVRAVLKAYGVEYEKSVPDK